MTNDGMSNSENFDNYSHKCSISDSTIYIASDIIANIISKCEFITFADGEIVKEDAYFKFNIEPNPDDNAVSFWYKVIFKLMTNNETIIVRDNQEFKLVDSFTYDITTKKYQDIVIDEVTINKSYAEKDVFHFALHDKKVQQEMKSALKDLEDLSKRAFSTYKRSNAFKKLLRMQNVTANNDKDYEKEQDVLKKRYGKMASDSDSITTITGSGEFADVENKERKNISDFVSITNQILNVVAIRYHMPADFFVKSSSMTDEQLTDFLTFTIAPICKMIETEINRKYYKIEGFFKGEKVLIDVTKVRHVNILNVASALDVLFRIGFSHNDLLGFLNKPANPEEWANAHYITKNYAEIAEMEE